MYASLVENLFFSQIISIKKKFSNTELKFFKLFYAKTNIFPVSVILVGKFVFFFVKSSDFLTAKRYLKKLRYIIQSRKLLVISAETTLIKLIFSFFDDTYIHNVRTNENPRRDIIEVLFLSHKDRAVAVGKEGKYIKTVNYLFKNFVSFKNPDKKTEGIPMELRCSLTSL